MPDFKGYRTLLVNALFALPELASFFIQLLIAPEFGSMIPVEWKSSYALLIVAVNIWLRFKTDTAVGKAE